MEIQFCVVHVLTCHVVEDTCQILVTFQCHNKKNTLQFIIYNIFIQSSQDKFWSASEQETNVTFHVLKKNDVRTNIFSFLFNLYQYFSRWQCYNWLTQNHFFLHFLLSFQLGQNKVAYRKSASYVEVVFHFHFF